MDADADVAGSLIDALAGEGEHVDDGGFTLDPAAALRKLREHQLADPHEHILLLVEAAWVAAEDHRSGRLHVRFGPTTIVEFAGVALERGSLRELFAAVLVGHPKLDGEALRRARVLQLLGLAANGALALEPSELVIEASDARGQTERLRIGPDGALTVEPGEPNEPGTIRWEFRSDLLGRPWILPERRLLTQRCRLTNLEIIVDGERISAGPSADLRDPDVRDGKPVTTVIMHRGRGIGLAGHTRALAAPASAWIVNRGVAIAEPDAGLLPGISAVVEVDLPMDLSRKALIEGPELEAVRAAIREARARLPRPRIAKPGSKSKSKPAADNRGWYGLVALLLAIGLSFVSNRINANEQRERKRIERTVKLRAECAAGVQAACKSLLAVGGQPEGERLELLGWACTAGLEDRCAELAGLLLTGFDELPPSDRERGFSALCRVGQRSFCELPEGADELARLLERGCEDGIPGACSGLLERVLPAAPESAATELLRRCEQAPREACLAAAWAFYYGFVDADALALADALIVDGLLERACRAELTKACRLRARPTLAEACAGDDVLACYALALAAYRDEPTRLPDDAVLALDKACKLALPEACHAAGVARARGLPGYADLDGAARDFARACRLDHPDSCEAERWATVRAAVDRGLSPPPGAPEQPSLAFPPNQPPIGAEPWSP